MRALRATFRSSVLLVLVGWMIVVGIPVIFRGGSVSTISGACGDQPCGDLPWEAIWLAGCVLIVVIGLLTRGRAADR